MKKFSFVAFSALSLLLLNACARTPGTLPSSQLDTRWSEYTKTAHSSVAPYRMSMSLRFGEEGNTRRVTALLWGNGSEALRLDVSAGVGAQLANISEKGEHFLVFSPRDNTAYFYEGKNKPLLKVGVPLPFNLAQLASLLQGHFAQVFGTARETDAHEENLEGTLSITYALQNTPGGKLSLDAQGRPVRWREEDRQGWQMTITYGDNDLPHRLTLEHSEGKRAIVLVKERETPQQPFTESQLSIDIPPQARLLPLEEFLKNKKQ